MNINESTDDNPTLLALSALMDGESTDGKADTNDPAAEKLLIDTLQNNEMRAHWTTTHVTRDVLRAEYNTALPANFASQLRARIDLEEPEHVTAVSHGANVVGLDQRRARKSATQSKLKSKSAASEVWRSVAGLGVAAGVAGAAFMFTQNSHYSGNVPQPIQTAEVTRIFPATQIASSGNGGTSDFQLLVAGGTQLAHEGTRWRTMAEVPRNSEIEQRLNMLLTNHLENASISSMQGMLSHSRVVGYDGVLASE